MTPTPPSWLTPLRVAGGGHDPVSVLATVARHLAEIAGSSDLTVAVDQRWPRGVELPEDALPPPGPTVPDALGWAYETLAAPGQRRLGLHYTPPAVADRLVALALDGLDGLDGLDETTVCDPACGGGAFLLAAARRLAGAGIDRVTVVEQRISGTDIDPVAVAVATTSLLLWCRDATAVPRVTEADALCGGAWPNRPTHGFDVVVGNPPFQSQLGSATARSGDQAARLRTALGDGTAGYVDTAGMFLLAAVGQVRVGGRIVLIQPQSVLGARDAAALRRRMDDEAPLAGLWICDDRVFAAATHVCAPILRPGTTGSARVARWWGRAVRPAPDASRPAPGQWAALAADLRGIPSVALPEGVLPEAARATAGFRDQFYGLVPYVDEASGAPDERPLVTSGLIDPGGCAWGNREVRFAKARWRRPVVDMAGLAAGDPTLARWVTERLVPKVIVATQTRVIEVAVDELGVWVPSTPVIAVPAAPDRLWHLGAALSAPAITAWALRLTAGTALVPDALKLSAAHVRRLPAPVDHAAWDEGAERLREAQRAVDVEGRRDALVAMGSAMTAAYGHAEGDEVLTWWIGRLPRPG